MLIKRICNDIETTWKVLAQHLMDVTITDLCKKLSVRSLNCKPKSNFYFDLLNIWYNFIATKPQNFSELMSQPIFYNDFFTINGKYMLHGFSDWITNGILRGSDIVNTDGSFCSKNSLQTKHGLTVSDMQYNQIISVLNSKLNF